VENVEAIAPVATITVELESGEVCHIAFFLTEGSEPIVAVGVDNPAHAERYAALLQEGAFNVRNASFVSPPHEQAGEGSDGGGESQIPF